ncbi:hypothetical protein ACJJTC_003807 [Scirpophaga incertulas]
MFTPDTSGNSSMSITRYLRPERFDTEPGTNGAELRQLAPLPNESLTEDHESPPLVNPNEDNVLPGPSSPQEVLSNEGKALSPSDSSPILPVSSETAPRCSGRERRAPAYLKDYMYT